MDDMPCPRFKRQGTAKAFGRAPACFTERVKKRRHRLPGGWEKTFRSAEGFFNEIRLRREILRLRSLRTAHFVARG